MIRPEDDALIQRAIDRALTPDEEARLAQLIGESPEARERVAQLEELVALIESLDPAEAPPALAHTVHTHVSHRPRTTHTTFQRGVAVNKKMLFGLAAAAMIVLAVISYYSNPPATVGTEATIGAAQRAQTPQINPNDVKLGDTSAQDVLQTETFDAIMKDDALRTMLQDANFRKILQDAEVRTALQDNEVRAFFADPAMTRRLSDAALMRSLTDPAAAKKLSADANMRALITRKALVNALQDENFRSLITRGGYAAALAGPAMHQALKDPNFASALRRPDFASRMARSARG